MTDDTFCILAWNHLQIDPSGACKMCCIAGEYIGDKHRPYKLLEKSYDEIWNSDYLRQARQAMATGRQVAACQRCYHEESTLGQSRRLTMNQYWLNHCGLTKEDLISSAEKNNFSLETNPVFLQLNMGSLCNLACRMCSGRYSSKIANDPVHKIWMAEPNVEAKWAHSPVLFNEILSNPHNLQRIILQGGEPLLLNDVKRLMDYLINAGASTNLDVELVTNATVVTQATSKRLSKFKAAYVVCSVDGFERDYEYIRYPARWTQLMKNVEQFRLLPNVDLVFSIAVQAYNLLNIHKIFEFCDVNHIKLYAHCLVGPQHLSVLVLPPEIREIAKSRLLEFIANGTMKINIDSAKYITDYLDKHTQVFHDQHLDTFMMFTNDLDHSRGQNIKQTHPELLALLMSVGYRWKEIFRHYKASGL